MSTADKRREEQRTQRLIVVKKGDKPLTARKIASLLGEDRRVEVSDRKRESK